MYCVLRAYTNERTIILLFPLSPPSSLSSFLALFLVPSLVHAPSCSVCLPLTLDLDLALSLSHTHKHTCTRRRFQGLLEDLPNM